MTDVGVIGMCEEILEEYYAGEIAELVETSEGREARSLVIDWEDVEEFDELLADDYVRLPSKVKDGLESALAAFEEESGELEDVEVRVGNLPEGREYMVDEYLPSELSEAVAVRGQVAQVSQSKPELTLAVFDCLKCGTLTEIPQPDGSVETREPHECKGCER